MPTCSRLWAARTLCVSFVHRQKRALSIANTHDQGRKKKRACILLSNVFGVMCTCVHLWVPFSAGPRMCWLCRAVNGTNQPLQATFLFWGVILRIPVSQIPSSSICSDLFVFIGITTHYPLLQHRAPTCFFSFQRDASGAQTAGFLAQKSPMPFSADLVLHASWCMCSGSIEKQPRWT